MQEADLNLQGKASPAQKTANRRKIMDYAAMAGMGFWEIMNEFERYGL
jgi:hypothetical protein